MNHQRQDPENLPGFPAHVQQQLQQAASQVTAARHSTQQPDLRGLAPVRSNRGRTRPYDSTGQGSQQSFHHPQQGPRTLPYQQTSVSASVRHHPQNFDPQLFPPLGSVPPHARAQGRLTDNQHTGSKQQQNMSADSAQAFFERARAGAYRGSSSAHHRRQPVNPHQRAQQQWSQALVPQNGFVRPQPQNNRLYNPPNSTRTMFDPHSHNREKVIIQCDYLNDLATNALQYELNTSELQEKETFRKKLERIVQSLVTEYAKENVTVSPKNVKLKCYGSLANGFAVQGSDMDLLLMFPKDEGPIGPIEVESRRMMEKAFLDLGYGARLLTNTRVPILRVCQSPSPELLKNLRQNRKKWEEEEKQGELDKAQVVTVDRNRLPDLTPKEVAANHKIFAGFDNAPEEVPLPPSPAREYADLEYRGDVGIQCDINFSNYVAIYNTTLLRCYCKCDPRVRQMGLFVKAWAKARKINTPYHGTLSSYGYILMVLHFLMNVTNPPVLQNLQHMKKDEDAWNNKTDIELFEGFDIRFMSDEDKIAGAAKAGQITSNSESLGSLIRGFFRYYVDNRGFRWANEVISIRTVGGTVTKQSKGWTEAKWTGDNNQIRLRYLLAIEDPFEIEHNIARTVGHTGVFAIRGEFRRAWDILNRVEIDPDLGWQWRKADGTVGEDLLELVEDRGDLLKKDQDYHREKQRELKEMMKAKAKAEEEAGNKAEMTVDATKNGDERKDDDMAGNDQKRSAKTHEFGMLMSFDFGTWESDRRAIEASSISHRSKSKLTENLGPRQQRPKNSSGRNRRVRRGSDGSSNGVTSKSGLSSQVTKHTMKENGGPTTGTENCEISRDINFPNPDAQIRLEDVSVKSLNNDLSKPGAWDVTTHAGRWLVWRDKKIRTGEWRGTPNQFYERLNHLFPFDPERPSSPSIHGQQKQNKLLREKRLAYFQSSSQSPSPESQQETEDSVAVQSDIHNQKENADQQQPRKDSAISGIGSAKPVITHQKHHRSSTGGPSLPKTSHMKNLARSSGDIMPSSNSKSTSASLNPRAQFTPRDEETDIIPIPRTLGFQFDPRQLRDLEIIKEGGNGCARRGEEWDVEIEGEWGGGGEMGMKPSTGTEYITGSGGTNVYEMGNGDVEGLLSELPAALDL